MDLKFGETFREMSSRGIDVASTLCTWPICSRFSHDTRHHGVGSMDVVDVIQIQIKTQVFCGFKARDGRLVCYGQAAINCWGMCFWCLNVGVCLNLSLLSLQLLRWCLWMCTIERTLYALYLSNSSNIHQSRSIAFATKDMLRFHELASLIHQVVRVFSWSTSKYVAAAQIHWVWRRPKSLLSEHPDFIEGNLSNKHPMAKYQQPSTTQDKTPDISLPYRCALDLNSPYRLTAQGSVPAALLQPSMEPLSPWWMLSSPLNSWTTWRQPQQEEISTRSVVIVTKARSNDLSWSSHNHLVSQSSAEVRDTLTGSIPWFGCAEPHFRMLKLDPKFYPSRTFI